ncbi:MAG: CmcI family methyltransferase [Microcoleaceae cyanobacterium]
MQQTFSPANYKSALDAEFHQVVSQSDQRFVKIGDRKDECALSPSVWEALHANQWLSTWKGIVIQKGFCQLSIYPMLICELQPKTIIELGSCSGASAVWLTDQLKIFNIEGQVYSIDIDPSLLNETAKADRRVKFVQGDCNRIEEILTPEFMATLPHPWLVIEDAHVNTIGIMDHLHSNGLQSGDYIIVEDTNLYMWEYWSDKGWQVEHEVKEMPHLLSELRGWLQSHEEEYKVDSYFQDMYGYNVSKSWNSILRRM